MKVKLMGEPGFRDMPVGATFAGVGIEAIILDHTDFKQLMEAGPKIKGWIEQVGVRMVPPQTTGLIIDGEATRV